MLLMLSEYLARFHSAFRVFQYLTLRGILAAMTALAIALLIGPAMIGWLSRYQIGQRVRSDGPQTHLTKAGTPTMGGALILVAIAATTLLWADLSNRLVWVVLIVTLGFGIVGWVDDYRKVVHRNPKGLPARWKYFWQSVIGLAAAIYLNYSSMPGQTEFIVPFFKFVAYPMGALGFIVLSYFVIVGTSNAVNLTDGLDGLAISLFTVAVVTYTALAYVTGHRTFADYLLIVRFPLAAELTIFCGALVGASLGFLWYNSYPAEVFMGDVGSLALGGALGTVAILIKQELLLPLVGGVFALELLSVVIQVTSFRLTGKRVFRMAPIHHHFELSGWSEPKVYARFVIVGIVFALFSLTTLKLR